MRPALVPAITEGVGLASEYGGYLPRRLTRDDRKRRLAKASFLREA